MSWHDALTQRFHDGRCLAAAGRADEAHPVFLECVVGNPASGEFAAEYLSNLPARTASNPPATAKEDEVELKRALGQQDWAAVLRLGPRLLAASSRRLPQLLALAAACEGQGFAAAQAVYLQAAADLARENPDILRQLAKVLACLERFDAAVDCWRKIAALTSDDDEAGQSIAALTIAKRRRVANLAGDDPAQTPPITAPQQHAQHEAVTWFAITHPDALAPVAATSGGLERTPIQQLEAVIRDRPSIPDLYLRLAQLYLERDREYDAERLLRKGRDATDHDARVSQMWEEVTLKRHRDRARLAEQEAQAANNPQTQDALAQAQKELSRLELEIYRSRVKREPHSAIHHLGLGRCLSLAGKSREAAEHFALALADNRACPAAALEYGRCLEQQGDLPAALKHYRLAADSAGLEQREEQIAALYAAGKLALTVKLPRLAQRYLARLLRLDPSHREAAVLMQGL